MDVLLKRGTSKALSNYVGTVGELTVGTDDYSVRLMTGETKGGIELARKDKVILHRYTSMFVLGFDKDQTYDLTEFFQRLYELKYRSGSIIVFSFYYAQGSIITDGTNDCKINGGTLIASMISNQDNPWSCNYATFIPCNESKIYNFLLYYGNDNGTRISTKSIMIIGS